MKSWRMLGVLAVAGGLAVAGCGGGSSNSSNASSSSPGSGGGTSSSSTNLTGAGSTLVAPLMSKWESDYSSKHGVTVTYGAIGSGGGISQITARTVDFGASDAPLTPDQAKAAKGVLQIPWALAATDIAYNVQGVGNGLKLTGPVLADIYLGKITSWNDPQIAKLNPGMNLPSTKITPIYRSDGSGDTYALTDYLSKVSPEWKSKVGTSTQVSFPTGVGGKGNDGVGGALAKTDGSIAYVAISYVLANKFTYADIQNAAGNYPTPDIKSISAAAAALKSVPADNKVSIVDPPASAPDAYPISTFTYALVPQQSKNAAGLKAFLTYAIGDGQQFAGSLEFAPLPKQILRADKSTIAKITTG